MSGHQYAIIGETVYFYFASNDTSGSGDDGASPLFDVREAGAAADAASLLSGTPTLLSHGDFPAGCYEVAVVATTGNGFADGDTFGVFCTLTVDSQNPSGFVGSCTLNPAPANLTEYLGTDVTGTIINVDDIGLIHSSIITSDAGLVLTLATAFPYDDWVNLPCVIKDMSAGPGGSVVRTITASNQAAETLTIDAELPFTLEDGVDEFRIFPTPAIAQALQNYSGPTRLDATTDKDEILAVVATVDTVVDSVLVDTTAIKDKTDQLAFTSGNVKSDLRKIAGSDDLGTHGDGGQKYGP